ncbi:MAG: xylulokinase [Planctomycetota bacterium]|jgi:xylulokinase
MTNGNILALDVGTQSARAAVVTVDGKILGLEQIQHEVDSPRPGWAQQRPDAWWEETCRAVRQVLAGTGVPAESIAAVASCGQMHGMVGLDDRGAVTTPWVQLWCDKRCQSQCEAIRRQHDEAALARVTANPIVPSWTGPKIRWFLENQPEAYERARWFLVPKDFINYRLTGVAATDPSEASGSYLWDWENDAYSPEMADVVGVDLGRFAPVYPAHDVIGTVTDGAAGETGLAAGTPVVAGGGDFPVSMLGFGIVGEGIACDVTGTSTLFAMHSPKPLVHRAVFNLRHVVDGWIPFKLLDTGGLSVSWCRDLLTSARDDEISFDAMIDMASKVPPGSEGLIFYPYMLGERRLDNAAARGAYLGITLSHTLGHFARAAMEGVALAMGLDMELFGSLGVKVRRFLCVGGGTRNALWNQIKADVLRVPIEISDEPEAGLKGAAILGAAGAGLAGDPAATACQRRAAARKVAPQPAGAEAYRAALDEFRRVYDHMLGFWQPSETRS